MRRKLFSQLNKRQGIRVTFLGIAVIAVLFSSYSGLFHTPNVYAANECAKILSESTFAPTQYSTTDRVDMNSDGSCPSGYGMASPPITNTPTANACNSLASCVAEVVYWFTAGLGGAAAYLAAWVLSIATALSLSSTAYALDFITQGWTIVRDLANMLFVLILVYLALTIMFKADTHDTAKKLAWVIVIALVINFSFFFTRVVIDAGNLLAVQFYNSIKAPGIGESMKGGDLPGSEVTALVGEGGATKDLTYSVMQGIGIQKIMSDTAFKQFQNRNAETGVQGFVAELLLLIFIYITVGAMFFMLAAAFLTVAIKFIMRIAVLWLLIIASPLAFVANTLQEGKHWYRQWQSALISHAFYPAFFLFVFYILTLFMANLTGGNPDNTIISQAFGGADPTARTDSFSYIISVIASVVVRMGFVLALLYIGLKASEAMGVMGAHFAENVGKRITSYAGGLPLRGAIAGTGALGRNTVGWSGNYINRNANLRTLEQAGGVKGLFARGLRTAGASVSNKTFDARNAPGAAKAFGLGGLIDVGTGQKGGYLDRLKASKEAKVKYAKGLEPNDADKERALANAKADPEIDYANRDAAIKDMETEAKTLEQRANQLTDPDARSATLQKIEGLKKDIGKRRTELEEDVKKRAKELSGEGLSKTYVKENLLNPDALLTAGNPGFVTMASRLAAAELLKKKNPKEEAVAALKALGEITDGGGHGGGDDHGGGGGKGGGGGSKGSGASGSKTSATAKDSAGKGDSHGAHASIEEHTEKMVTAIERMAQRLERTVEHGFHGLGEQLHQENKYASSQTLRANSSKIGDAANAIRPVAAVPTTPTTAVPPKPSVQTRLNTPPVPPRPASSANDNVAKGLDKAA